MDNNDVLRRLRYCFDFSDPAVVALFEKGGEHIDRAQLTTWLKREGDPELQELGDAEFAAFLNGLIKEKRGEREGPARPNETRLNNNLIFMKLKIALNLQAEEVLRLMKAGGLSLSKHELSAFFRKTGHKHYRECKDQSLRSFLKGLQLEMRPDSAKA